MPKIIENDDIQGIQRLIQRLAAEEGIAVYKLAERSGLHPTTLYAILKKKPGPRRRPVQRETIRALADGNQYNVSFNAIGRKVVFQKVVTPLPHNDREELLDGIRSIILRSHKARISPEERQRILGVLQVLLR